MTAAASNGTEANLLMAQTAETEVVSQATKEMGELADEATLPKLRPSDKLKQQSLNPVASPHGPSSTYVWIGSSSSEGSDVASMVNHFDEEELATRDGIGII